MGRVGRFILGGVLIGASFALPGIGVALSAGMKAALLSTGLSFSSNAVFEMIAGSGRRQNAIELNNPDNQAPLPVVYGTTKLGLRVADMRVGGSDNKFLYIVGALCHGSSDGNGIQAIGKIYFDDELAIDAAGVVQGRFAGKVAFAKYLGTDAQAADPTMTAAFPEYTITTRGRGVAYIMVRLEADADVFPTGIPNVTAIVDGCKVLDPRVGGAFVFTRSGVPDPGRNPALALYDYITSIRYGMESPTTELDTASFIAMANYYDETVTRDSTLSTSGPRFQLNGWLDVGQLVEDNIKQLLTSCRGNLIFEGGKYRLFTRRVVTPTTFTLTEHNIVGNWRIRTPGISEAPNMLRYSYIDPGTTDTYAAETRFWPRPGAANAYLTDDNNYEVIADAELPMTVDAYMAEQIALVTLKEQRSGIVVELTATEEALQLQVGDLTPVKHATPGWTTGNDLIWIMGMFLLPTGQIRIVGLRYDANAYTLDALTTHPARPATSLPNPYTCQAPGSADPANEDPLVLEASDDQAAPDRDGSHRVYINATWIATVEPYLENYEVEYRRSGTENWRPVPDHHRTDLEARIGPVSEGTAYDVRVRAVNRLGIPSAWIVDTITPHLPTLQRSGSYWIDDFSSQTPGRRWVKLSGAGSIVDVYDPDSQVGGKVGRVTGEAWYVHADAIPFDANLLYNFRARIRQLRDPSVGSKVCSIGLMGLAQLPGQPGVFRLVNTFGLDSIDNQHWVLAKGIEIQAGRPWTDLFAHVKGYAGGKIPLTASMISHSGLGSFSAANCCDGDTSPSQVAFNTNSAAAGSYLLFDLGTPRFVTDCRFHMSADGSTDQWVLEFADDAGGPWTVAS